MAVEVTLKVRAATLEMLRDCVRDRIQALFDDPHGVCDSDYQITVYEVALMDACTDLDMNFWAIVQEETTEVERRRIFAITGINQPLR